MIRTELLSPKAAWAASILTAVLFTAGIVLAVASSSLSGQLQGFLEQQVFHRSFDSEKWLPTIISLLSYPLFIAILAAALLYLTLPFKNRLFLLCVYAAGICILLIVCFIQNTDRFIDSDMGAEIVLAKECFRQKSFWPRTWCYSTELRTLNTQLISAPLFCFTGNWHLVKTLTCIACLPLLVWSSWNLLTALGIQSMTLKAAVSLISTCPYSLSVWQFVTLGNYYVPKIVIFFVHLSLFLTLAFESGGAGRLTAQKRQIRLIILYALSFIEGLTSIRYIFVLLLPLTAVSVWQQASRVADTSSGDSTGTGDRSQTAGRPQAGTTAKPQGDGEAPFRLRAVWSDAKSRLSCLSLLAAAAGYLVNSTLLRMFYRFSLWYETAFGKLDDIPLSTVYHDLLKTLGYNEQVSVSTPAGITNLLLYAFAAMLLFFTVRFIICDRRSYGEAQAFYLCFTLTSIVLTSFLYLHVNYVARYFILELAFIPAFTAIIVEGQPSRKTTGGTTAGAGETTIGTAGTRETTAGAGEKKHELARYLLALTGSLFVLTNSFTTLITTGSLNVNVDKAGVIAYLDQSGMQFGYATTPLANRLAFLMDGKIEFAMVKSRELPSGADLLPDRFEPNLFLSSRRFYEDSFHQGEAVFFLIDTKSWEASHDNSVFKGGNLTYDDGIYRVYTYPSPAAFKESFEQ